MKILAVSALLCAMMVLTAAAPAPEEEPEEAPVAVEKKELEDEEAPVDLLEVVKRDTQGWTQIGKRYFRYEARDLTWAEAEQNCRSLGGHLASLHSYNEYQQIQSHVTPSWNPSAWLGGTDSLREGNWQWADGTNFIYSNWCAGEPNNGAGTNQDCLQMSYSGHNCWDDLWCDKRIPSVCVKN